MSVLYLLFLSVLQGVTELFPVSSLGHTILLPAVFHHPLDREAPQLLPFLVALHLGTAVALLAYFRHDWVRLLGGAARSLRGERNADGRLLGLVLLGSVPAGVVGLILQHPLERLFSAPIVVALVLMLNGALLFLGERRLPPSHTALEGLTARQALWVGAAQIGALIPGLSRSGLTLAAGMRAGLTREAAAEFAFLLGTPIILAAGVLELPKLARDHAALGSALLGGVLTGIAAWLSLRFLMRYLGEHRLTAFAGYCVAAGALSALALLVFPLR